MLHRLRHRLGYLILLLFVPGLGLTSAGEARAHGPLDTAAIDSGTHLLLKSSLSVALSSFLLLLLSLCVYRCARIRVV